MTQLQSIYQGYRILAVAILDRAVTDTHLGNINEMVDFLESDKGQAILAMSGIEESLVINQVLKTTREEPALKRKDNKPKRVQGRPVEITLRGKVVGTANNMKETARFCKLSYSTVIRCLRDNHKAKTGHSFKLMKKHS